MKPNKPASARQLRKRKMIRDLSIKYHHFKIRCKERLGIDMTIWKILDIVNDINHDKIPLAFEDKNTYIYMHNLTPTEKDKVQFIFFNKVDNIPLTVYTPHMMYKYIKKIKYEH